MKKELSLDNLDEIKVIDYELSNRNHCDHSQAPTPNLTDLCTPPQISDLTTPP